MAQATARRAKQKKRHLTMPLWQRGIRYGEVDIAFFLIVIALLVIGIIMMFSASYAWAIAEGQSGSYYAAEQIKNAIIGVVLMLVLTMVDYHFFEKPVIAWLSYLGSLLLLAAVFVPGIGFTEGGATRWIALGTNQFSFQPSELMKISIIIFVSYLIMRRQTWIKQFLKGLLPILLCIGIVVVLLILEPHISATLIILSVCVVLLFVGGANLKHFLIFGGIGLVGLVATILVMSARYDYIGKRFASWRDPFSDALGDTLQTCQSLIAIGSGGIFGLGLGESRQKFLYLPETKNDFVFSIVCEELGYVGALTVLLLFTLLMIRGYYIGIHAKDKFGMLMAIGFTTHIGMQALLNIAVVCNLIPNTGISLPFFSYGGTALIFQLAEMGIVLNISRTRYRLPAARTGILPAAQTAPAPEPEDPADRYAEDTEQWDEADHYGYGYTD